MQRPLPIRELTGVVFSGYVSAEVRRREHANQAGATTELHGIQLDTEQVHHSCKDVRSLHLDEFGGVLVTICDGRVVRIGGNRIDSMSFK